MLPADVIKIWNKTKNEETFKEHLRDQGFKFLGSGLDSVVFTKPRIEFVVKVSEGVLPTHKIPHPKLEEYRLGYIFTNRQRSVGIQMRVNRSNRYRAWARIRDSVDVNIDEFDIHQQNVGWYLGKPVIIDYV